MHTLSSLYKRSVEDIKRNSTWFPVTDRLKLGRKGH